MKVTGQLIGGRELAPLLCRYIMDRSGNPNWNMGNANAIGVVRGSRIIVAVAYNDFHWPNISMHIAAEPGSLWASPWFFQQAFTYPFIQLQCRRVTGIVARRNRPIRNLCEKLGFKLEGTLKDALPNDDLMIYGMLKRNCRYIEQEQRKVA